jgi:hypothetical protein
MLAWSSWSALLWRTKGTSKRSLDSFGYGCLDGANELLGEGFDLSGDGRVGVGHWFSWAFLSRQSYGANGRWATRSKWQGMIQSLTTR